MAETSKRRAPTGLGARGRRFWTKPTGVYELTEGEAELLAECCRTLDALDALAAVIAADGPTSRGSTGQVTVHPALTEARNQRLALHRLLSALALPDEDGKATVLSSQSASGKQGARVRWAGVRTEAAIRRAGGVA
ncbi:hypothetical protein BH11ACT1_BH11ACT1_19220 [soil metagenome]